jgi:hypothetical protein
LPSVTTTGADPGTGRDVAVRADLGAAAYAGKSIDHRALADIGADIDEAGHKHAARRDIGTFPRHGARHHAEARLVKARIVPSGKLARHLVESRMAGAAAFHHAVVVEAEAKENGLFKPLIDLPAAITIGLCHARLAAVEHGERAFDGIAHVTAVGRDRGPVIPGSFDGLGELCGH